MDPYVDIPPSWWGAGGSYGAKSHDTEGEGDERTEGGRGKEEGKKGLRSNRSSIQPFAMENHSSHVRLSPGYSVRHRRSSPGAAPTPQIAF